MRWEPIFKGYDEKKGATAQRHNGAMAQWRNGATAQWRNGVMA
jgi:hypothetical protein